MGNSIEGLKEDQLSEYKPSVIQHIPQSQFETASKDDWQFVASPKGMKNIDPLYSESIALNQGDSVIEHQYRNVSPKKADLLGLGGTINDSKMSTDYITQDYFITQKTEENEFLEKRKKAAPSNIHLDTLIEQGTYMQSPSQIKKPETFSPLRYSSHPDILANLYASKRASNTPSGKDYFSNTTFGTHPANSIEFSSQKLNTIGTIPTVGLSTKKLYENLLTDSTANVAVDLMNLTQHQPSVSQYSSNQSKYKDSATQMSAKKDLANGQEGYITPQLYTSSNAQKKAYRDPNIMTIEEYRAHDGQIHSIDEESYAELFQNRMNGRGKEIHAQSSANLKILGDQNGYQNV